MLDREAFAEAVRGGDDAIDLAAAALLIASIDGPVRQPGAYLERLDELADGFGRQRPVVAAPATTLAALGEWLAQAHGFRGNTQHYSDPRNSCLNHVLDRRTGIPITLSVVYLEVGWRLGLPLVGVGLPGHFLIKYAVEAGEPVIADPFYGGRLLTPEDCAERLRGVYGRPVPLEPHYLAAVTRRQLLSRMLTNLKHIYDHAADYPRLLETIEGLLLISPWALDEIRDRGLVRLQLHQLEAATPDLETYLRYRADAADAPQVRRALDRLRRR